MRDIKEILGEDPVEKPEGEIVRVLDLPSEKEPTPRPAAQASSFVRVVV